MSSIEMPYASNISDNKIIKFLVKNKILVSIVTFVLIVAIVLVIVLVIVPAVKNTGSTNNNIDPKKEYANSYCMRLIRSKGSTTANMDDNDVRKMFMNEYDGCVYDILNPTLTDPTLTDPTLLTNSKPFTDPTQNNVMGEIEVSTKQSGKDDVTNNLKLKTNTNTDNQGNRFIPDTSKNQVELNDLSITPVNKNIQTKKFSNTFNRKISTVDGSHSSMTYINKGPLLNFKDVYYGTSDKTCGSYINLNGRIKHDINEQSLYIDNTILNNLIDNKCQDHQHLYLTGTVEGEEFI